MPCVVDEVTRIRISGVVAVSGALEHGGAVEAVADRCPADAQRLLKDAGHAAIIPSGHLEANWRCRLKPGDGRIGAAGWTPRDAGVRPAQPCLSQALAFPGGERGR